MSINNVEKKKKKSEEEADKMWMMQVWTDRYYRYSREWTSGVRMVLTMMQE